MSYVKGAAAMAAAAAAMAAGVDGCGINCRLMPMNKRPLRCRAAPQALQIDDPDRT